MLALSALPSLRSLRSSRACTASLGSVNCLESHSAPMRSLASSRLSSDDAPCDEAVDPGEGDRFLEDGRITYRPSSVPTSAMAVAMGWTQFQGALGMAETGADALARGLVREYLLRKGLSEALRTFDEEAVSRRPEGRPQFISPATSASRVQPAGESVASTADLVRSLRLGTLYKKSKAAGESVLVPRRGRTRRRHLLARRQASRLGS